MCSVLLPVIFSHCTATDLFLSGTLRELDFCQTLPGQLGGVDPKHIDRFDCLSKWSSIPFMLQVRAKLEARAVPWLRDVCLENPNPMFEELGETGGPSSGKRKGRRAGGEL